MKPQPVTVIIRSFKFITTLRSAWCLEHICYTRELSGTSARTSDNPFPSYPPQSTMFSQLRSTSPRLLSRCRTLWSSRPHQPLALISPHRWSFEFCSRKYSAMSFPSTVKAITIAKTGDFDVIEKTEIPFPEVAPNHVVIKVRPTFIEMQRHLLDEGWIDSKRRREFH